MEDKVKEVTNEINNFTNSYSGGETEQRHDRQKVFDEFVEDLARKRIKEEWDMVVRWTTWGMAVRWTTWVMAVR